MAAPAIENTDAHIFKTIETLVCKVVGIAQLRSAGRASDRNGRFESVVVPGIFLPESASSADSFKASMQPWCEVACIKIWAHVKNPQNIGSHIPVFRHMKTRQTRLGMGSAAPALTSVRMLKIPNTGSHIPVFRHMKTRQTWIGMGSAAPALTSVRMLKIPKTGSHIPVFRHMKTRQTRIGMGSAAPAAAVPYLGTAT